MKRQAFKALACAAFAAGVASAQENYAQWTGLRTYYLNTSATGANVGGTVRDFPLLVRLVAADSAVFAAAKAGGADLRFTKPNGMRLQHQIEEWNAAGRSAAIWVRVDTVRGNTANQQLRMHWGKADAADSSRPAAVFDTANGFVAVWHMEGAANVADATANALGAVAGGSPGTGAGAVGPARTFDGATQYFTVANHARLNFTEQITLSLWVNAANWNGSTRLLQKSPVSDNNAGQWGLRDDSNNMLALNLNGIHTNNGTAPSPSTGEWHLIHATFDGSTTSQYQDGLLVASGGNSAPITVTDGDLSIARRPDGTSYLTGSLDEVRVHKVARSADWVRLEYENQKAGSSLLTTAPVSLRGSAAPVAAGFFVKPAGEGLAFHLPENRGTASITLMDLTGRLVWAGTFANGATRLAWDGRAAGGSRAPAGLYAARVILSDARGGASQVLDRKVLHAR